MVKNLFISFSYEPEFRHRCFLFAAHESGFFPPLVCSSIFTVMRKGQQPRTRFSNFTNKPIPECCTKLINNHHYIRYVTIQCLSNTCTKEMSEYSTKSPLIFYSSIKPRSMQSNLYRDLSCNYPLNLKTLF